MDILIQLKWQITLLVGITIFFGFFKKEISEFLQEISWLKTKWFELRRIREENFAKAEEVKRLSKELNKDKQELRKSIRIFTETLYLALSARHKFPIPKKISNDITKNLNILANQAIKTQSEKGEWKRRMNKIQELLKQEIG